MKKRKGFTLIELVAIIIILALVAIISVPIIAGIVSMAQKGAYRESIRGIFEATNIYLTSNDFAKFPSEGINVTNPLIKMKNKDFISGMIYKNDDNKLELDRVSNNIFCGSGIIEDLRVVKGSCDQLDITPPTITITSNLITSSSIIIIAVGEDLESGISGYQFSKDNGTTWTDKQTSNIYSFTNLKNNTNYTFKVKTYNNNGLSTISSDLVIKTNDIPIPTYTVDTTEWSKNKVVTIHYPTREINYVYQYSIDGALTWQEVISPATTKEVVFNENGTIIARILDGTNEISGAVYSITNIDLTNPIIDFSLNGDNTYAKSGNPTVTASDTLSGILGSSLKFQWTTNTVTPTEVSFTSAFTNGSPINTPAGVTGDYYLWILVKDNAGNTLIARTNVFKLDNIVPVINVNPLNITITLGDTYNDTGISASDNINENITSNVVRTGNVNTSIAGTYTLIYNVTDSSGNAANSVTRIVTVNPITEYRYRTSSTSTSCSTCYDMCYSYTTGTATYSCSSGSLSGTSCVSSYNVYSTFHATYTCSGGTWTWSSHYCTGNCSSPCSNGSSPNGYQYSSTCPSGSCTSGTTSCSNYWMGTCYTSSSATVTYVCPSGYSGGGSSSSCSQSYSCNPYSCNCSTTTTWSSWSSWSTTPVTVTATRQVETREITSI